MTLALGTSMLAIAACGGDDKTGGGELTLVDYFSAYESISKATEAQIDSIAPEIGSDATVAEVKAALVATFEETRDIVGQMVAKLAEIAPPDGAQSLHDDTIEAAIGFVEAIDGILAEVEDLEDISDFNAFDTAEFEAANERLAANCLDLQKLADDEEIDVDLNCE